MKLILVDTCGWIEWLTNGKLVKSFEPFLKNQRQLVIPTIIQYELHKWICREKNEITAAEIIGVTEQGFIIPLDTSLALHASELSKMHKLAMADSIVYATSLKENAILITADKCFKDLLNVHYLEKK